MHAWLEDLVLAWVVAAGDASNLKDRTAQLAQVNIKKTMLEHELDKVHSNYKRRYVCMYVCVYVCMRVCVYACMRVCMCARVHACMYV